MDARLQLKTHAHSVRIETDGWESVPGPDMKKKANNQSIIANKNKWINKLNTREKKRKLIIQCQIEKEKIYIERKH